MLKDSGLDVSELGRRWISTDIASGRTAGQCVDERGGGTSMAHDNDADSNRRDDH